jgi:hypothetical protein
MNEHLRDRVLRKLETLSDERAYQVLDYVEFLESKYAERQAPPTNIFTRFTEAVEDRLRAGKVSASAIAETMGLMSRAMNVLNGVAAAGRSVASDLASAAASRSGATPAAGTPTMGASAPSTTGGAAVAATATGSGAPAAPAPTAQPEQASNDEARTTEGGDLDPPLSR